MSSQKFFIIFIDRLSHLTPNITIDDDFSAFANFYLFIFPRIAFDGRFKREFNAIEGGKLHRTICGYSQCLIYKLFMNAKQ